MFLPILVFTLSLFGATVVSQFLSPPSNLSIFPSQTLVIRTVFQLGDLSQERSTPKPD